MAHPRGESGSDAVRLDFDRRLMLQFRGSLMTSDAGLLAYRELDDVLGLTEMAGDVLADARSGKNGRHALAGLFRQSVFGRLAGYEDVNDAERACATIRRCAGLGIVLDMDSSVSPTHGPATCTVPMAGMVCSSRSLRATRARSHASISGRTRLLQCPRSTSSWKASGSNMRSGYRRRGAAGQ